jgi:hypothetical protein
MNHVWPRVIVTVLILSAAVTLLILGCVAESAGVGIIMAIVGFWFGQYTPTPDP